MTKEKLAQQLRQRQYKSKLVSKDLVDSLTDDQIIDSYITCACCKEKQVESGKLDFIINLANNCQDFFNMCDNEALKKKHN